LSISNENDSVIAENDIEMGAFVCEVPGLLCHEDEVDASGGIPRWVINIPETRILVDVSHSPVFLQRIRRSFNFNCIVKLVRINGEIRVGLYALRARGPLADERSSRGPAIPAQTDLYLPLDGEIPYPVEKPFWKLKKESKAKPRAKPKPPEVVRKTEPPVKKKRETEPEAKVMKTRARTDFPFQISLLSAFIENAVPPIPFVLKDPKKIEAAAQDQSSIRTRLRNPRTRAGSGPS
jgi:hypothetical protein